MIIFFTMLFFFGLGLIFLGQSYKPHKSTNSRVNDLLPDWQKRRNL